MDIVEALEELTIELFYRALEAPNLLTGQVLMAFAAACESLTLAVARQVEREKTR